MQTVQEIGTEPGPETQDMASAPVTELETEWCPRYMAKSSLTFLGLNMVMSFGPT